VNYLTEMNAFYDWLMYNSLPTGVIALWHALMAINNKTSWADEFTVANIVLQGMTGLSRQGLDRARNTLIQKELIQYKKGTSNQAGKYKFLCFECKIIGTRTVLKKDKGNLDSKIIGTEHDTKRAQDDTQSGHSSCTLTKLNVNETKLNKDDDDVAENPFKFYSQNIGPLLPMVSELILQYQKDLPDELIIQAMKIAVLNNVRKPRYIENTWINWIKDGVKNIDDYHRHEAERTAKNVSTGNQKPVEPKKRQYTKNEVEAAAGYIKKALNQFIGEGNMSLDEIKQFINSDRFDYEPELKERALANLRNEGIAV